MNWTKMISDKRRWRQYKAASKDLPEPYRGAMEGVERYLMFAGPGSSDVTMWEDLLELFQASAANGTPVRAIVGDDPVEFVESFVANYTEGDWRTKERERLLRTIARAAGETP